MLTRFLIGWYFNRRILPWDNDIDIVLTGKSIENFKKLDNFETDEIIITWPYNLNIIIHNISINTQNLYVIKFNINN